MTNLPQDFETATRRLMGDSLYDRFRQSLDAEPPASIRLNPFKTATAGGQLAVPQAMAVPWCRHGWYLDSRPDFTFDPLLHAGLYYVQEASSMFLDHVLRWLVRRPVTMLDLCAAPGGKTTCAMAALPAGSVLFSNEPIRTRAHILDENVQKFGHPNIIVTNDHAADYARTGLQFDIILTDVPCSGEGMFRKDANAIAQWSMRKVAECQQLQRGIVGGIWPCLKPGGVLVYSTCTFNVHEDEENVEWIASQLGATPVPVPVETSWGITGSLKDGNGGLGDRLPVCRFIPGKTKGEGLFMAVLRKKGGKTPLEDDGAGDTTPDKASRERTRKNLTARMGKGLHVLSWGVKPDAAKGKGMVPDVSKALSILPDKDGYPKVDIDYATAIAYLRHEAIVLPQQAPRGILLVTYRQQPLGFVKNVGNRANNLYPQEWKIKSTHLPDSIPHVVDLANRLPSP